MLTRTTFLAGVAAVLVVPVAAQARPDRHEQSRLNSQLNDPIVQAQVAAMAAVMSQTLLDVNVGPMARAVGEWDRAARDIPGDAHLGDLLGPDARYASRDFAREIPRAMNMLGRTAEAVDEMAPQFESMARQMRHAIGQARVSRP